MTKVAITGVGLHTAHGDASATALALAQGRSGVTWDHPWNKGRSPFPAAPAPDPAPTEFLADRKAIKYMGPCTQMAVLAAGRALRNAGLLGSDHAGIRADMALFVATGPIAFDVEGALRSIGPDGTEDLLALRQEGLRKCHPLLPFKMLLNMPLGLVSITFGLRGANAILYPGPEQGALGLSHALRGLRAGRFSRALVGGNAHTLALSPLLSLERSGKLRTETGDGFAPADQAAFLVLETESAARERGARVVGWLRDVTVLGPGTVDKAWKSATVIPNSILTTGACTQAEKIGDETRAHTVWPGARVTTVDGSLGVAPAASFVLATAIACLPDALVDRGEHVMISFHDEQAAAVAMVSAPEAA